MRTHQGSEVLRGAGRTLAVSHPSLFLEMHGATMNEKRRKVAGLVDFLEQSGYVVHVETDTAIPATNGSVAVQGRLYIARYPRGKLSCGTRERKPWFSASKFGRGEESNAL